MTRMKLRLDTPLPSPLPSALPLDLPSALPPLTQGLLATPPHSSPRVLLVEDSPVELAIIRKILEDNGILVVGTAMNGAQALAKIPSLDLDVICTDYHMPVMDGMALTQAVMARYPRPILVLSISAQPYQVHNILNILQAGALDVMAKPLPHHGGVAQTDAKLLVEKIRILSGVRVIAHPKAPGSATLRPQPLAHTPNTPRTALTVPKPNSPKLGMGPRSWVWVHRPAAPRLC